MTLDMLAVACAILAAILAYRVGFAVGEYRMAVLLFGTEEGFAQYVDYLKGDGQAARSQRALVRCLRETYGLDACWDSQAGAWTFFENPYERR